MHFYIQNVKFFSKKMPGRQSGRLEEISGRFRKFESGNTGKITERWYRVFVSEFFSGLF